MSSSLLVTGEVLPGSVSFITIAPALNCATIIDDMKAMMNSDAIKPIAGLPKRIRNRSGTVSAPVRRDSCAIRLPSTPKPVIGTTM